MEFEILNDSELITHDTFIRKLIDICNDCCHEVYLTEVFLPFLRMCCVSGTKVVPIFDDRAVGRKTSEETFVKYRMKTISAPKEVGYVVPDYIFVTDDYSYINPRKPILMVETKLPNIDYKEKGMYYRDLVDYIRENQIELSAEIDACGYVVFTDGFTWMFLTKENGKIVESKEFKTIRLLEKYESFYSTNRVNMKTEKRKVDFSFIGEDVQEIEFQPAEWDDIKKQYYKAFEVAFKKVVLIRFS